MSAGTAELGPKPGATPRVLLYGATGFSGGLIAERLTDLGDALVLGGRDPERLAALGARLGHETRVFELGDDDAIDAALADITVVLHAAGPFRDTAAAMLAGCLRNACDYLDLAGEWPVFAAAMDLDAAAAAAGVMLMPGVGFSIAASDCLLDLAVRRAPGTVKLRLGISRPPRIARGSIETILGLNANYVLVRRAGRLERRPAGTLAHDFDFGGGATGARAVSWPDVVTGQFTTGIADIETYAETGLAGTIAIRLGAAAVPFLGNDPARAWLRAAGGFWPEVPAENVDQPGFVLVVEALDRWRRPTVVRLRTGDGYAVTTTTASAIVRRVLRGERRPGFQTPAKLFGGEFILDLGCAIPELATT